MKLRHSPHKEMSMPERSEKLREFTTKLWDGTKRFGKRAAKFAVAAGLGLSLVFGGCGGNEESPKSRFEETGILTTPFDGKLLKDKDGNYYMANRLLVGFSKDVSDEEVLALFKQYNAKITGKIPQLRIYEIEVDKGRLDDTISAAKGFSFVSFAERNYFAEMTTLDNDAYQGDGKDALWWSKVIQLSEAYKYIEENGVQLRSTTVAVIDASFDLEISELRNQYVDKRYHHDFGEIISDNDVSNKDMWSLVFSIRLDEGKLIDMDPRVIIHGTEVAALVAAENNSVMINGVAYTTRVLPLKHMSASLFNELIRGTLSQALVTDNFATAAALGYIDEVKDELNIRAVNMSFAFKKGLIELPSVEIGPFKTLKKAIENLYSHGVVLVAGAGNDNTDSSNYYPCAYPEVICVGGTELKDGVEQRWSGSNFSDDINALVISAPGNNILTVHRVPTSLFSSKDYIEEVWADSGTSFASPIVAGAAALLKSIDPTLTPAETLQLLRDTADDVQTDKGTWKRVNVYKAVAKLVEKTESCGKLANNEDQVLMCDEGNGIKINKCDKGVLIEGPCLHEGCTKLKNGTTRYDIKDGLIAFTVNDNGNSDIELIDLQTGERKRIPRNNNEDSGLIYSLPRITGKNVAFMRGGQVGGYQVASYDTLLDNVTTLGNAGEIMLAAGDNLVAFDGGDGYYKIYNLNNAEITKIKYACSSFMGCELAVSNAGIAVAGPRSYNDAPSSGALLIHDLSEDLTGTKWQALPETATGGHVAMHQDMIAFTQDYDVFVHNINSGSISQVTQIGMVLGGLDIWGTKIAAIHTILPSDVGGYEGNWGDNIFVSDIANEAFQYLTNGIHFSMESPRIYGRKVLFSSVSIEHTNDGLFLCIFGE